MPISQTPVPSSRWSIGGQQLGMVRCYGPVISKMKDMLQRNSAASNGRLDLLALYLGRSKAKIACITGQWSTCVTERLKVNMCH